MIIESRRSGRKKIQQPLQGHVCLFVCLFGSLRRINPCGSLASDGIKLNMMKMEKVKIYKIK